MSSTVCAIGKDVVPASFKGMGFWCTRPASEMDRQVAGGFPFRITAYTDPRRKVWTFNLTAVFREDDHVLDASAFFAICESPQPGILVHPTRGTHLVACRQITVSDKLEDRRVTTGFGLSELILLVQD